MQQHINKFVAVWALALTAFLLMGMRIPYSFTPGSTISSAEMNANFDAVKDAIDLLEKDVADLRVRSRFPGRVVGMARVTWGGYLVKSWMENGETPIVTHWDTGEYMINWPGEDVNLNKRVMFATTVGYNTGYTNVRTAGNVRQVFTYNKDGELFNQDFWVILLSE